MRYFGGKTRICNEIAMFLISIRKPNQIFLSPFVGGAWVESLIDEPKICNDKHPYLIEMYKALQKGWIPPKSISKDQYDYIKKHKDENIPLTGFVGFGCSFAGKWFGGYAQETSSHSPNVSRNFCLNAHKSLLNKMKNFRNTIFQCLDYRELKPKDMLIYCDPPYSETTQYEKQILGHFDHEEFWNIMKEWGRNNVVIISEYSSPKGFNEILSIKTKTDIIDKNNKKIYRTEKLFTPNDLKQINTDKNNFYKNIFQSM